MKSTLILMVLLACSNAGAQTEDLDASGSGCSWSESAGGGSAIEDLSIVDSTPCFKLDQGNSWIAFVSYDCKCELAVVIRGELKPCMDPCEDYQGFISFSGTEYGGGTPTHLGVGDGWGHLPETDVEIIREHIQVDCGSRYKFKLVAKCRCLNEYPDFSIPDGDGAPMAVMGCKDRTVLIDESASCTGSCSNTPPEDIVVEGY